MDSRPVLSSVCVGIFLVFGCLQGALAGGFDNSYIGVKGGALGHAMTGIADDASAVYYNPAGLVFLPEKRWDGEAYLYFNFVHFRYEDATGPVPAVDRSDPFYYVPGMFLCRTYEKWAWGCGFYVPYGGGGVDYDNFQGSGHPATYLAGFSAFTPALAFKLRRDLALGVGFSLYYGQMKSELFDPAFASMVKTRYQRVAAGYGGHASVFYKPSERLSLGFTFRSKVPIRMGGSVAPITDWIILDSEVAFTLPYAFSFGIGYRPISDVTLGFTMDYSLWGDMEDITFTTAGKENVSRTYYKNNFLFGVGVDWKAMESLALRGGVKYAQGATEDRGLNPLSNDIDLLVVSLGLAFEATRTLEVNLNTAYTYGFEREYRSRKYDLDTVLVMVGVRYRR